MAERDSRSVRQIQLSPQALFAAERLAEIAGLPVVDLLEVVLLELAESGAAVEAGLNRKRPQRQPNIERRPADVIPIERARLSPRHAYGRRPSRRRRVASPGPEAGIDAAAAPSPRGQSDHERRIDD
jgi:hypothetical protein